MADTAIADFLKAEGFVSPASAAAARTALEGAGLTRPASTAWPTRSWTAPGDP